MARHTGQRIPCFDRCQLIIIWISNTKEVHSKPRLHVSLSTCYLEYGRHVARLHRRRRRRAYAPTSNTASHDNHEKINSWVSFCSPYMGCLRGSAWRPFGPRSSAIISAQLLHQHACKTSAPVFELKSNFISIQNFKAGNVKPPGMQWSKDF